MKLVIKIKPGADPEDITQKLMKAVSAENIKLLENAKIKPILDENLFKQKRQKEERAKQVKKEMKKIEGGWEDIPKKLIIYILKENKEIIKSDKDTTVKLDCDTTYLIKSNLRTQQLWTIEWVYKIGTNKPKTEQKDIIEITTDKTPVTKEDNNHILCTLRNKKGDVLKQTKIYILTSISELQKERKKVLKTIDQIKEIKEQETIPSEELTDLLNEYQDLYKDDITYLKSQIQDLKRKYKGKRLIEEINLAIHDCEYVRKHYTDPEELETAYQFYVRLLITLEKELKIKKSERPLLTPHKILTLIENGNFQIGSLKLTPKELKNLEVKYKPSIDKDVGTLLSVTLGTQIGFTPKLVIAKETPIKLQEKEILESTELKKPTIMIHSLANPRKPIEKIKTNQDNKKVILVERAIYRISTYGISGEGIIQWEQTINPQTEKRKFGEQFEIIPSQEGYVKCEIEQNGLITGTTIVLIEFPEIMKTPTQPERTKTKMGIGQVGPTPEIKETRTKTEQGPLAKFKKRT